MSLAAAAAALGFFDEMVVGAGSEACWLCTAFICSTRFDPAEVGGDGDARVGAIGDAPLDAACMLAGVDMRRRGAFAGRAMSTQPRPLRGGGVLRWSPRRTRKCRGAVLCGTRAGTRLDREGSPYPW